MRTPNHGTTTTKITQRALTHPLMSWSRKTSTNTVITSQNKITHAKTYRTPRMKSPNVQSAASTMPNLPRKTASVSMARRTRRRYRGAVDEQPEPLPPRRARGSAEDVADEMDAETYEPADHGAVD